MRATLLGFTALSSLCLPLAAPAQPLEQRVTALETEAAALEALLAGVIRSVSGPSAWRAGARLQTN